MNGSGRSAHQVDGGGESLSLVPPGTNEVSFGWRNWDIGFFFAPTQKLLGGRLDVERPSVPSGPFVFVTVATRCRRSPDSDGGPRSQLTPLAVSHVEDVNNAAVSTCWCPPAPGPEDRGERERSMSGPFFYPSQSHLHTLYFVDFTASIFLFF